MEIVGNMKREYSVEWVIPNFLSLSQEAGVYYCSHTFFFNGAFWYLKIYPNGDEEYSSDGCIDLVLVKKSSYHDIIQEFSLSLKNSSGKIEEEIDCENYFNDTFEDGKSLISRTVLLERKSELLLDDALTVVCTLKYPESNTDENQRCICQDFKAVLLDGLNHDLTLKVGDKELRAHQDVLRARSQVFKSMLSHDMKEKNSGVINIPDCDPEAMKQFLSYIYCGKVDTLEESNMSNLYYIADKYDMKELKEECSAFMKKTLSITNICEVIQIALNHTDSSLLEFATDYFKNNMLDIMRTLEWQSFLKDNSVVANELLIKSIENLKM